MTNNNNAKLIATFAARAAKVDKKAWGAGLLPATWGMDPEEKADYEAWSRERDEVLEEAKAE